jgi:hypothetical protein
MHIAIMRATQLVLGWGGGKPDLPIAKGILHGTLDDLTAGLYSDRDLVSHWNRSE